jgi:DNA-binding IscR family transcriptional regulator
MGGTTMRTTPSVIETVWIHVQEQFLNHPTAALTAADIRRHAGADAEVCEAVLATLVEAGVVERAGAGYRLARPQRLAA